ncbi:MAG: S8 family serine peptidase [Sphingobacteriales bacterium JAD_PAG50586_3]|nr:MAG: S8 family serine peptidase [Sphingobacteriales bacterium JAD_PAG50586_3]
MRARWQAYCTIVLIALLYSGFVSAQSKFRVYFKDKQTEFNPFTYFDAKAIDRRVKSGLSLTDSTDFPVNQSYINQVSALADSARPASRWFNCISVFTDAKRAADIAKLPFVKLVQQLLPDYPQPLCSYDFDTTIKVKNLKLMDAQLNMLGAAKFKDKGIDGKGIRIAILDAGFPTVDKNPAFEHIRNDKRIIATYDFCKNRESVYDFNSHGTMVMACIGGRLNGQNIGLATGADFLLARTESPGYEIYSEEEYWLAGAEWADKNGADIINSSLGYTNDLYFRHQMDGRHSIIAKAATMAVKKGILVVNAAGNEGDGNWKIVASPADADSVLTVGGVDPYRQYHSNFSSYGPNRNLKMKPNVSAAGTVATMGERSVTVASGTSFASPLTAGFAACAWQLNKDWKNTDLFDKIQQSASLYPYFDYAHGYGIPQAGFFIDTVKSIAPTFTVSLPTQGTDSTGNYSGINVKIDSLHFNVDWKLKDRLLFYHIENTKGYLDRYYVIEVEEENPLYVDSNELKKGEMLRIHYRGYTFEYKQPD